MNDDRLIYYCPHCYAAMILIYEKYVSCLICGRAFKKTFFNTQQNPLEKNDIIPAEQTQRKETFIITQ
jgi:hypothetical protein